VAVTPLSVAPPLPPGGVAPVADPDVADPPPPVAPAPEAPPVDVAPVVSPVSDVSEPVPVDVPVVPDDPEDVEAPPVVAAPAPLVTAWIWRSDSRAPHAADSAAIATSTTASLDRSIRPPSLTAKN
jgi:hypothetical protein